MTISTQARRAPLEAARSIVALALDLYRDDPAVHRELLDLDRAVDEPLRVALVGSVKAGKSTMLNALLGEHLAPTDSRECTRVVTWYRHSASPAVTAHRHEGGAVSLPLHRQADRLELDLGHLDAESVDRLDVAWPAATLTDLTLIDTPGMASISRDVSDRTRMFLGPDGGEGGADAVVYLLRSLHSSDVEFLHSLRERSNDGASALGTIAVLSRADELGAGRLDAMVSVNKAVATLRQDPALDGAVETIVPVAGLLALAGETLRQAEFTSLAQLEKLPRDDLKAVLTSADRFVTSTGDGLPTPQVRAELIERLGLFGVRLAIAMIRAGARDAPSLADQLVQHSGLDELRRVIDVHFRRRHPQLKSHATVVAVRRLVQDNPRPGTDAILAAAEEHLADAHSFREMRVLGRLRASKLQFGKADLAELERLIGADGTSPFDRLGLDPTTATLEQLRQRAMELFWKWQDLGANPLRDPESADACRVATRSAEGVLADLG